MNYYPFNIGDYAGNTRGLSLMEDLAYRRILDAYYQAEGPLTGDIARLVGMRDQAEAVAYILATYFKETPEGWRNGRADEVIAEYHAKAERARRNGKGGGRPKLANPEKPSRFDLEPKSVPTETQSVQKQTDLGTGSEANQEPITKNQKKKDQEQGARAAPLVLPEWLDPETWAKWHRYRNAGPKWTHDARRLSLRTLTELRGQGHDPLAVIEQSIERGWTGLFPIKETSHENRRANGAGSAVERVQAAIAAGRARDAIDADFFTVDGTVVASHG